MTNKEYAKKDKMFIECCKLVGVEPTTRQASKFRNGKGIVFMSTILPRKRGTIKI